MENYMEELINNTDLSKNRPIRDVVYESLREMIIEGNIPVGERIVEKEFADRLNISRTPIREALRKLEMDDLVEYIPRTGIIVKRISEQDVQEIYKIRKALEMLAVENTMVNITKDETENIKKLLDLTEQKNSIGEVQEVFRLFSKFNEEIYNASRMPRLKSMINNLNEYLKRFRRISVDDFARRGEALKEHRAILDAILSKDKEKAEEIIYKHLERSLDVVLDHFRENNK